jgi:acetyltransferase
VTARPFDWPRIVRMAGGVKFRIRPIRPDDAERERAFIMGLSPESRYLRLMYTLSEPSAEFIARMVQIDQHRSMALVAVIGHADEKKIIGVARYAADAGGQDCEFAVSIADEWQCRGIGTKLLKVLFEYAEHEGFRSIYGNVLAENQPMLDLSHQLGFTIEPAKLGQNTVRVVLRLN